MLTWNLSGGQNTGCRLTRTGGETKGNCATGSAHSNPVLLMPMMRLCPFHVAAGAKLPNKTPVARRMRMEESRPADLAEQGRERARPGKAWHPWRPWHHPGTSVWSGAPVAAPPRSFLLAVPTRTPRRSGNLLCCCAAKPTHSRRRTPTQPNHSPLNPRTHGPCSVQPPAGPRRQRGSLPGWMPFLARLRYVLARPDCPGGACPRCSNLLQDAPICPAIYPTGTATLPRLPTRRGTGTSRRQARRARHTAGGKYGPRETQDCTGGYTKPSLPPPSLESQALLTAPAAVFRQTPVKRQRIAE